MLEGTVVLGGVNFIVLAAAFKKAPNKFVFLIIASLISTATVYGTSGLILEGLCHICTLNSSVCSIISKVCYDDGHVDFGLLVFVGAFAILGSILFGLVILYNERRHS